MSSFVVQLCGANDSHHDRNTLGRHDNACNTMCSTTLHAHLCILKIGAHHQAPLLTVTIAMTHDGADKPPTSPCLYTRMCCVAVLLARCMNHAMEPSSPHAPCRHAPHGCMHHVITVCSTFSSFFFLLTSSFVFQPPRSNGTMVMMCGHEDTMDDDHRCSTTWCNATHHDHNTTRHDDCDHDSMQHNDPDCDDNTTW